MSLIAREHQWETIYFDAFDLMRVAFLAERIYAVKLATKAKTYRVDRQNTEFGLIYTGIMGEYAAYKFYNIPYDPEAFLGGDNGVDIVVDDTECHIKTSTFTGINNLKFYVNTLEDFTAPVGICAQVFSPLQVNLHGWISKDDFIAKHHICNFNYGDRRAVNTWDLSRMESLIDEVWF